MKLNYLYEMTTLQVEELLKKSSVALIPMGPTEVHGFYLPLCTDIETGIELAERTARKLGERGVECLITPAVPYCIANGLHAFAGNTTTRPETVKYLISDICTSLAKWGFRNILIICGHGEPPNDMAIKAGIEEAKERDPNVNARLSNWIHGYMIPEGGKLMKSECPDFELHAGEQEVGTMMMRRPELIDWDVLNQMEPNFPPADFWEKVSDTTHHYTFRDLGADKAYFGSPKLGSVEVVDEIYGHVSDFMADEVMELLNK